MRQLEAGNKVKGGFYFNQKTWDIAVLEGREAVLPGNAGERYFRVPTLVLLAGAPVFGGLYVVFLPFIGFAMLIQHLGKKAGSMLHHSAGEVAASFGPAWRPGEAYLHGKAKKAEKPEEKNAGEPKTKLDELQDEIEEKSGKKL